jgi:hypothetical protein
MFPPLYQNLDGHNFKDDREVETAATGWLITRHGLVSTGNREFYVHVTMHRNKFLYNKTN